MHIAQVAIDVPIPTLFDYLAPDLHRDDIGLRVLVPFGRRHVVGVVVGFSERAENPGITLKPIKAALRDAPPLPSELLALARFCADYYHHPLGQILATLLPQRLRRAGQRARAETYFTLTPAGRSTDVDQLPVRAAVQRKLLLALQAGPPLARAALLALSPSAPSALAALSKHGWITHTEEPAREPSAPQAPATNLPELNPDQANAVARICGDTRRYVPWLLLGVTGSGKTEVYLRLVAKLLGEGRQVLILVPEINLTPQTEQRFRARFPDARLVSLHSNLSEGERTQRWLMAGSGQAQLVLGTRLAVFTPMPQLGLIVVDEEHDASFKQQDGLRYSARDVAVLRAREANVPIVLGSATPSLESWQNAHTRRYQLLRLEMRAVAGARPPAVHCIDLRRERLTEGLSRPLIDALRNRLKRGEQSLVFLNRRGYAPVLMCGACGWLGECPRCSARLVLHLQAQRLRCHHCGHEAPVPRHCPHCGAADLAPVGQGTQRAELALQKLFPEARVLRVDRDSTRRKHALPEMLKSIHANAVDILVGTQMLAKGHDFPNLTLVGVLNADSGLYSADFRASERLFSQLLQVSGRAGRAGGNGEVLIQTAFPEHPLFRALQHGRYEEFATSALAEREQAGLPPFAFQALLRAEAGKLDDAVEFLTKALSLAPTADAVQIYDVVAAPLMRVAGRERAQVTVEARSRAGLQNFLARWMETLRAEKKHGVRWSLDVDPL